MEVKELLELIGLADVDQDNITVDTVRDHVNQTFVPIAQLGSRKDLIEPFVNKAYGARIGPLQTMLLKQAKENGLDVTHGEFKDKSIEEVVPELFQRFKSKIEVGAASPDADKYLREIDKIKGERDTYQSSLSDWQKKYTDLEANFADKEFRAKINAAKLAAFDSVKYPAGTKETEKIGFKAIFDNEFDLEIENENVFVAYKNGEKRGSRVQSPKNAAKMMTLQEAIEIKAKELLLWSDNPHEGRSAAPNRAYVPQASAAGQQQQQPTGRQAHPKFGIG